jgi:serine/threonine-protein kinase
MEGGLQSTGVQFGRYIIQARLARGGMGEVFRAVAVGPDDDPRPVVLKRLIPVDAGRRDLADLFLAEAAVMTRLVHENIAKVLDFGVGEDGDYYLVMELVHGMDLGRLCRWLWSRGEQLPVPVALHIAAEALRGLAHAHARSAAEGGLIVHRDISPGNVLLSAAGEVKIADFGVALAAPDPEDGSGEGGAGGRRALLVGKPDYMSPEQFDGEPVDGRADLFSLGVVLFEMLTGARPMQGASARERMDAARAGRRARAVDLRPEVGAGVEAILARALAPRPEDRFPDAEAMARAIEALREEGPPVAAGEALADLVAAAMREAPESAPVARLSGLTAESGRAEGDPEGRESSSDAGEGRDAGEARPSLRPRVSGASSTSVRSVRSVRPGAEGRPPQRSGAWAALALPAVAAVTWLLSVSVGGVDAMGGGPRLAAASPQLLAAAARLQAPPPPPPPPNERCDGEVLLHASHDWRVSGGPAEVQAPGRYRWPCGSFTLQATSKADPAERRQVAVTVSPGGEAVVDLR